MAPKGFDLQKIHDEFTAALQEGNVINMEHYLRGHAEITRLLELLGTVFGFVASDMRGKCNIIEDHRAERPRDFETVQAMIKYEMNAGLADRKTPSGRLSGSRTFLRLHRALEFFIVFLQRLVNAEDHAPTSTIASMTYGETLGTYHPWVVRSMAYLAMRTLPNKHQVITKYCKQTKEEAVVLGPITTEAMVKVYDVTQEIYAQNNLLKLP